MERCLTGVLVLRLTGEGDAVLETAGDKFLRVATLLALQEGVDVGAPYVLDRETTLAGCSRVHEQIDPSSPNLYETSQGSIHSVSWDGKYSEMFVSPVTFAASLTTGSRRQPLILIQRYALPWLGFVGFQWSLYLSINNSSIRLLNGLANCTGRCLCVRSFEMNSQPHCTSVFIVDSVLYSV
jgi:hypothetical protein